MIVKEEIFIAICSFTEEVLDGVLSIADNII